MSLPPRNFDFHGRNRLGIVAIDCLSVVVLHRPSPAKIAEIFVNRYGFQFADTSLQYRWYEI